MLSPNLIDEIKVRLLNTDYSLLGPEWSYSNVLSPFSRIYLITSGEGYIMPQKELIKLKKDYLYLIPAYTLCTYKCLDEMGQYYIHFTHTLPDGLKLFDRLQFKTQVEASELDLLLFKRLNDINPGLALKYADPSINKALYWKGVENYQGSNDKQLESIGIIKQLFSRFLSPMNASDIDTKDKLWITDVFKFINKNLSREIKIEELADLACYSKDHFSKQFKKTTGLKPIEYINQKRIEKAQELLITTSLSQKRISEQTGFTSLHYYTRVFKKMSGRAPAEYRRMGGLN